MQIWEHFSENFSSDLAPGWQRFFALASVAPIFLVQTLACLAAASFSMTVGSLLLRSWWGLAWCLIPSLRQQPTSLDLIWFNDLLFERLVSFGGKSFAPWRLACPIGPNAWDFWWALLYGALRLRPKCEMFCMDRNSFFHARGLRMYEHSPEGVANQFKNYIVNYIYIKK